MAASNYSGSRTYSTAFPILNFQGSNTLSNSGSSFANPTILPYATTQTGILTLKDLIKQSGYTASISPAVGAVAYGNRFDNVHPFSGGTTEVYCNYWKPTFTNTAAFNTTSVIGNYFDMGQSYTSGGAMTIAEAVSVMIDPPDTFTTLSPSIYFGLKVRSSTGLNALAVDANRNVIQGGSALAANATNGFLCVQTCAGTPSGTPSVAAAYSVAPVVIDTTNNQLCYYNPVTSAWMSPGLALLSRTVLGSAVATVTISSIPQTYNHLRLEFSGSGSANVSFKLTVNNVATATYDNIIFYGDNTGVARVSTRGDTGCKLPDLNTSASNTCCSCAVIFPNYRATTYFKTFIVSGGGMQSGAWGVTQQTFCSNRATTAISQIDLIPNAANLETGTVVSLYGYM